MIKQKKILIHLLILVIIFGNLAFGPSLRVLAKNEDNASGGGAPTKKEIIIKYKNVQNVQTKGLLKAASNSRFRSGKMRSRKQIAKYNMEVFSVENGADVKQLLKDIKADASVEYAQENFKLEINALPLDEKFVEQWALKNSGQNIEGQVGRTGADVNAVPAWDLTKGSETTLVGILDTGIDINHPDLKSSIYVNPKEIPNNGIDDDGNGYIDDVNGWDFANRDGSVYDSISQDAHGTGIAGIIAASADGQGITGVAPNVKLVPLKFMNGSIGYTSDLIEAIDYANAMGVKIINCSFGSTNDNPALRDAMKNSSMLFVCAAGNRGMSSAVSPVYPAAFNLPNVLAVAAIDSKGVLTPFSNYGSLIQVAAPGVNILSTSPEGGYEYLSGTSVSSAVGTGVAALLKSHDPSLTSAKLIERLKNNSTPCKNLQGKVAAEGRLNAYAALKNQKPAMDNYTGPGGDSAILPPGEQGTGDDSWYTLDQFSKIRERLHYGENGVNLVSGNYSLTNMDMSLNSPGFHIEMSRTYNSRNERNRFMGRGWTFGFEGWIYPASGVTVQLPNGSIQTFSKQPNGTYKASDSRSSLVGNADGTFVLTTKDQYSYGFDKNGWLTTMTDRDGNTITITVEPNTGKITAITDAVGRVFKIDYTGNLITSITDPANRVVRYEYANDRLAKVIDASGSVTTYQYDSAGFLNEIRDHRNQRIQSITYNHGVGENLHKVVKTIDDIGCENTYAYNTLERRTTVSINASRQWTYWYDEDFYGTRMQDPEGRSTFTEYYLTGTKNVYGDVKKQVDRAGNATAYEIDDRGNVVKVTFPDGSTKNFAYDGKNNKISETDEDGYTTYFVYDKNGVDLLKTAKAIHKTDTYDWLNEGNNTSDKFLTVTNTFFTEEERATLGYKAKGLLKSSTDANGKTTEFKYDVNGYLSSATDSEKHTTSYKTNILGWNEEVVSPGGNKTSVAYDKEGRPIKTTLNGGEVIRTVYDVLGRKTQEIAPGLYDPTKEDAATGGYTDDKGTRYIYTPTGLLSAVIDAENHKTEFTYDVYGNKLTEKKPSGAIYQFTYDNLDRLIRTAYVEKDGASPVTLEEDAYAILTGGKIRKTEKKFLNETETAVTVSIYDCRGRLEEVQNPDNTRIKTIYNKNGSVSSKTDGRGSETFFVYNEAGRLSEKWTPVEKSDGKALYTCTKFEYDRNGQLLKERTGKEKTEYGVQPATYVEKTYELTDSGKIKVATGSDGKRTEYIYDADGRTKEEKVFLNDTDTRWTEYEYNHLGKPTSMKVHVRAGDLKGNSPDNTSDLALTSTYTYDKDGNLVSQKTPDQKVTSFTYDQMGRVLTSTQPGKDETGADTQITTATTYDWAGNPLTITDGKGKVTKNEYDARGLLIRTTDTRGGVTAFYYDRSGRRIGSVSPRFYEESKKLEDMNHNTWEYDLMGRVLAEKYTYWSGTENTWKSTCQKAYRYDENGNVLKLLTGKGYMSGSGSNTYEKIFSGYGTEYTYNLANLPIRELDPETKDRERSYAKKTEYDALGRKITETNAIGAVTSYSYDDGGNVLTISSQKNGGNKLTLMTNTYDKGGRLISQTDGNGNTVIMEYTALSQLRRKILPGDDSVSANTIVYQYDEMGRLDSATDSEGNQEQTSYDPQGRVLSHTVQKTDGSDQVTVSARYDQNGNKRFETDGNGNVREMVYDPAGLLLQVKQTVGGKEKNTSFTYDGNGNMLSQTDWRGNVSMNTYDPLNRVIETKNPYGTVQTLVYDENNMQIEAKDASGQATRFQYDKDGRLISTTDAEGHTTAQGYDIVGNLSSKTDGNGNQTQFTYDEFGRLKTVVNAKNETTAYDYDGNGNLLSQTDGNGNKTAFEYNRMNQLIRRIDAGGRSNGIYQASKVESYTYYADGRLKTKKDRNGRVTTFAYTAQGWLKEQSIGSMQLRFQYDKNGNPLVMEDSTGQTVRAYDAENRVTEKTVPNMGRTSYTYDTLMGEGGYSETTVDPKGNETVRAYDKASRLSAVMFDGQTTSYAYDENGNRKTVSYPNGATEDYSYYRNHLLKELVNQAGGTVVDTYSYTYDGANNQLTKTEKKGTTSYTYDSLNRLETVAEQEGKNTTYSYDRGGNRISETVTAGGKTQSTKYVYNPQNRLVETTIQQATGTEKTAFTYDGNGNLLTKTISKLETAGAEDGTTSLSVNGKDGKNVTTYKYDELNQMIQTTEGKNLLTYRYNGEGKRVEKTVNGKTTRYLYEADQVILEEDGSGNQTGRNVQGINTLARTVDGQTMYYLYNGHGDVTGLLNGAGALQATYRYDAFGNVTEQTGVVRNSITFAGYQRDEETGLYYLNARMYDPAIARFLQEDSYRGTANDPLSLNLYSYCANEPVMYSDPTGHFRSNSGPLISKDDGGGRHGGSRNNGVQTIDVSKSTSEGTTNIILRKERDGKDVRITAGDKPTVVYVDHGVDISSLSIEGKNVSVISDGTIRNLNANAENNIVINNKDGLIGALKTGDGTNTTTVNEGYIEDLETSDKSTLNVENTGDIGQVRGGKDSRLNIENLGEIREIITGASSTNEIYNYGILERLVTANGSVTRFADNALGFDVTIEGELSLAFAQTLEYGEVKRKVAKANLKTDIYGGGGGDLTIVLVEVEAYLANKATPEQIKRALDTVRRGGEAAAQLVKLVKSGCVEKALEFLDCMEKGTGHPYGIYEDATYHGDTGNSWKSKAPINGQDALDHSISMGDNTNRRISISNGEFVILDRTSSGLYHGHVRPWNGLTQQMQAVLRKAGLVTKKGKIIE